MNLYSLYQWVMDYIQRGIDENVLCVLAALFAMLYLRRVLLVPAFLTAILMFLPSLIFISDYNYSDITSSPVSLIMICWGVELAFMTLAKMFAGYLYGLNPFCSVKSILLIAACVFLAVVATENPSLVSKYLPGTDLSTIYAATIGIPVSYMLLRTFARFIPTCIYCVCIVAALLFVANGQQGIDVSSYVKGVEFDSVKIPVNNYISSSSTLQQAYQGGQKVVDTVKDFIR